MAWYFLLAYAYRRGDGSGKRPATRGETPLERTLGEASSGKLPHPVLGFCRKARLTSRSTYLSDVDP